MTVIDQLVRELDSAEVQETKAHPLKRRTYQNAGRNHFWPYDGYDKFRPYGFPTHGCIDGWGFWTKIIFCINTNLDFGSITPQTLVCLTLLIKLKLALRKDYSQVWF